MNLKTIILLFFLFGNYAQTISLNEADTEFLIGAMGNEIADQDLGLHYIKLNENRDKVIKHDYFLLNERVRDMVVSKDKKLIIIFLESTSSIPSPCFVTEKSNLHLLSSVEIEYIFLSLKSFMVSLLKSDLLKFFSFDKPILIL